MALASPSLFLFPTVLLFSVLIFYGLVGLELKVLQALLGSQAFVIGTIVILEKTMPWRRDQDKSPGDTLVDAKHTLTVIPISIIVIPLVALAASKTPTQLGMAVWPVHWPMFVQVTIAG